MRIVSLATVFILFLCALPPCYADWTLEAGTGDAYNLPMQLWIKQASQKTISRTARYRTNAFKMPLYYQLRIGKWDYESGWELELVHHKIYLKNKPSTIQSFSISHGYNMLSLIRAWKTNYFIWRVGAGPMIPHPESIVRMRKLKSEQGGLFNAGYYFAGVTSQVGIEKRFYLTNHFYLGAEAKATASFVKVRVRDGNAKVPLIAFHALLHGGYQFGGGQEAA